MCQVILLTEQVIPVPCNRGEYWNNSLSLSLPVCFCFLLQKRRVLCIKEVEILGHMSIDWQYPFEDFVQSPGVDGNLLKISVEVRNLNHTFRAKNLLEE